MRFKSNEQRKAAFAKMNSGRYDVTKKLMKLPEIEEKRITGRGSLEKRIGDIGIKLEGGISIEHRKIRRESSESFLF